MFLPSQNQTKHRSRCISPPPVSSLFLQPWPARSHLAQQPGCWAAQSESHQDQPAVAQGALCQRPGLRPNQDVRRGPQPSSSAKTQAEERRGGAGEGTRKEQAGIWLMAQFQLMDWLSHLDGTAWGLQRAPSPVWASAASALRGLPANLQKAPLQKGKCTAPQPGLSLL